MLSSIRVFDPKMVREDEILLKSTKNSKELDFIQKQGKFDRKGVYKIKTIITIGRNVDWD